MADAWTETAIAVVTEFGRTARTNGTDGTDHGTATVALVLRRRIAGWPHIADAGAARPTSTKAATSSRRSTCARC